MSASPSPDLQARLIKELTEWREQERADAACTRNETRAVHVGRASMCTDVMALIEREAASSRPPSPSPRRACECSEPDPVMQADQKFYCYQCSFETGARPRLLPEMAAPPPLVYTCHCCGLTLTRALCEECGAQIFGDALPSAPSPHDDHCEAEQPALPVTGYTACGCKDRASAPSPQPSADSSEISVCGHVGSGASQEAPPSTPEDWEWALDRVTKMCGAALADAHVYGKKLLRGFGYPNETFSRAQDYRALAIVLDRIRSSQPSAEAEQPLCRRCGLPFLEDRVCSGAHFTLLCAEAERPAGETDWRSHHAKAAWLLDQVRAALGYGTHGSSEPTGRPTPSDDDLPRLVRERTGEASHLRRLLAELVGWADNEAQKAKMWVYQANHIERVCNQLEAALSSTGEAATSAPTPYEAEQ